MAIVSATFVEGQARISGYVLYNGRAVMVSVIDAQDEMVTVQACEGQPFEHPHYGTTDTITIPAYQFKPLFSKLADRPSNLLGLALAAAKPQWCSGEAVYLVSTPGREAWLKNDNGFITLNVTGYRKGLLVYLLTANGDWKTARNLESNYQAWAAKAKAAIETERLAKLAPKSNRPAFSERRA